MIMYINYVLFDAVQMYYLMLSIILCYFSVFILCLLTLAARDTSQGI